MNPFLALTFFTTGVGLYGLYRSTKPKPTNKQVENRVLMSLASANNIPIPPIEDWAQVEYRGDTWLVAPRYIAPVGIKEAEDIAHSHGLELPDPGLVDAIWQAADLKVAPLPRGASSNPPSDYTMRTMNSVATNVDQLARIKEQIADKPFRLLAGTHKDVVRKNGVLGIYGWHRLDGRPIQGFFSRHSEGWKDYSQGLRLVKKVTMQA